MFRRPVGREPLLWRNTIQTIRQSLKKLAAAICPICRRRSAGNSYAQEGEDRILASIFHDRPRGFYVDVGAHDPKWCSVTYLFYELGWRGINIDPLPTAKAKFDALRPNDVTVECGVAAERGELKYTTYPLAALNTFDEATVRSRLRDPAYPAPLGSFLRPVRPLRDILGEHLDPGQRVDFLTVDTEGMDLTVLHTHDWDRWRPYAVVVEGAGSVEEVLESPIYTYLRSLNYRLCARTRITNIYTCEVK